MIITQQIDYKIQAKRVDLYLVCVIHAL